MKETQALSPQDIAILHQHGLDAQALHGCTVREYAFGERVVTEGMPLDYLFAVTAGKVKVGITAPNGKNLIMCFYVSDGLIGEAEFFAGCTPANTTVVALGPFRCVAVPVPRNRDWLAHSLPFAHTAAALAQKLHVADSAVAAALYPAEVRLSRYILGAAESGVFRDVMTDVACSVGISYRHLYRTLAALCADGVLEKILDPNALQARALAEN